ncbi:MAG TPA: helicase-related protein, partial [Gemmatimonadales bacterium]|nr:helicase-related protein [Gemmatimonadales bacterium]
MSSWRPTSGWRVVTASRCWRWPDAPRVVAEALVDVAEPLSGVVGVGPAAPAPEVARAMAAAMALPVSPVSPPAWLLPSQRQSFGRARAALDRYGGALLAESVGTGKSWIALAVAASQRGGGPATAIVPAALVEQWNATAARAGVRINLWSHERLSRGRTPPGRSGLVIIDESHRFRNPATRRYLTLAPWLADRRVLLLSATPVVNHLADLSAQLLLGVPDDALRPFGYPSIRRELDEGRGCSALGEVVVQSITASGGPERYHHSIVINALVPPPIVEGLDRLACSKLKPIARLIAGVAWRAAASSPAALLGVLNRYRTLLHHANDALREGRPLDRARLREFTGQLIEQMVMWGLLDSPAQPTARDLDLEDLPRLDDLIPQARAWYEAGDEKLRRLGRLLGDRRPTLVFTVARETVRYLRDRLPPPVAWSSGERAGLGSSALPRPVVWSWFSPNGTWAGTGSRPSTLVSTDVAAEGLDLQRAERVVHYDLPWTEVRMAQRDGRAARLGSWHGRVEIVRFLPPPEIETRLAQTQILSRKAALPERAGLGTRGREMWQWRDLGGQALKDFLAAESPQAAP